MDIQIRTNMKYLYKPYNLRNLIITIVGKEMENWALVYAACLSVGG